MAKKIPENNARALNRYETFHNAKKYFLEGISLFNKPNFKRVLFGRLAQLDKEKPVIDIVKKGHQSHYIGWVFQTDHHQDAWSIDKDEAFYAGAMAAKKTFHLITNINDCINAELFKFYRYLKKNEELFFRNAGALMQREHPVGVTKSEILWMIDNHYTYRISTNNPLETVFEPSKDTPDKPSIINYDPELWNTSDWQEAVIDRLIEIKRHIQAARAEFAAKNNVNLSRRMSI